MTETLDIFGVRVTDTNLSMAAQTIDGWIQQRVKTYVCVAPVSTVVQCQEDKDYCQIVNKAGMVTPDGMPIVWTGKLMGKKRIGRTYGPDLMLVLCEQGQMKGYRHFFYGGTPPANQRLVEKLKQRFPKINIVGNLAPAAQAVGEMDSAQTLEAINNAQADILWVGLGSPKQDYWMHNHRDRLNVPVMIGVGAAFDFVAGIKKQAPVWMRKIGLEWLFRLCCEPGRLWRRYFFGNSKFIYLSMRYWFTRRMTRK